MTHEKVIEARHCAGFLISKLQELCSTDNLLVSDIAMDLIEKAVAIDTKLARVSQALREEEVTA